MSIKKYIFNILFCITLVIADLRMASSPKKNFVVEDGDGAIPFSENSIAIYTEPSDFNYQGLVNQREDNYDNFLRSNIDNEQDNRNFETEIGRDMLPFRTLEANVINNDVITVIMGQETLIPLRWNNPHSSECEINIWIKSSTGEEIVIPIKKPSCCGEGYQDNMISFTIPLDFNQLASKVQGFTGCNKIGDCTLQIYGHSVEPRTYIISNPIIINGNIIDPATYVVPINNNQVKPATVDPQLNINILPNEVCLPTTHPTSNYISAVPRFARLVSDQFNHAYQNSDYSPYSGQQHEMISKNLQAATILRMTAANGGELGRSILTEENKKFIDDLIAKVNGVVQKYEKAANNIFNDIKNNFAMTGTIGDQQLANCFRCTDTGSVNTNRLEQQTYIPSFEIKDFNIANQVKKLLNDDVKNLLSVNTNTVRIYEASLSELNNDFIEASRLGFVYQPAMIKSNITTMEDPTNFLKIDANGKNDDGVYASTFALRTKKENIDLITSQSLPINIPTTTVNYQPTIINTNIPIDTNTLPPNPDDLPQILPSNFCGQTYQTIDCNKPCPSGIDSACVIGICFSTTKCTITP